MPLSTIFQLYRGGQILRKQCPYNNKDKRTKETFEDTKGLIRRRKSKQDRQHNGQQKKGNRTNNVLQKIKHISKDLVTNCGGTHVLQKGN